MNKTTKHNTPSIDIKSESYVNAVRLTPSKTSIAMDFAFIPSNIREIKNLDSVKVLNRIVVTHSFAKRISKYINETLERYNKNNKK